MRPVKRALKMLESPEQDVEDKDQVAQTRQVGDGLFTLDVCFIQDLNNSLLSVISVCSR